LATYLLDVNQKETQEHVQGVEVNLCSLVTAMTDQAADDGVELEAQWELFPPTGT
jgi:hypothetical protein